MGGARYAAADPISSCVCCHFQNAKSGHLYCTFFGLPFCTSGGQVVRRQKAIADKEGLTKQKARALDEKKRAEKKAALAKKKVGRLNE